MARTHDEPITYRRRSDLPGFELWQLDGVPASFVHYASGFELLTSTGFRGQLWHRGGEFQFHPGDVLCARPGEVVSVRQLAEVGGLAVASLDPALLEDLAGGCVAAELWGAPHACESLARQLRELATVLDTEIDEACARGLLCRVVEALVSEFSLEPPTARSDVAGLAARRVHEALHSDASQRADLATLAELVGMSRFQALRAFKRHYGLPPQAYQLRLRLSLAQRALRAGVSPARVAAEFGFTDQSHLTRHFKRALGVTPATYARAS